MPTHLFLLLSYLSPISSLSALSLSATMSRSVLGALPFHQLLPEKGVLSTLLEAVALKDLTKVVASSLVFLSGLSGHLIASLHLLDQFFEQLSVLLGEV